MIRSFFLLSVRNLLGRNKAFTIINICGLTVGFASILLVALFIHDEYSFDRFNTKADRVQRIILDFTSEEGNTVQWARTSAPIGKYLAGAFPEVEQVVRLRKNPGTDLLVNAEIKFYEERLFFADSSLFKVFDVKLKTGNPDKALTDKNSIVVTEELAHKYFGDSDPIGRTLRLNNKADLKVTGVIEAMPGNSHFIADAFVTFSTLDDFLGEKRLTHWGWMDHYTYVLLTDGSASEQLEKKLPELIKKNAPEWVAENEKLYLQPLTSIHLHSDRKDEVTPNSNESYSYILGTIAVFILLMACANFINVSTATLVSRFKEISIQKVLGASKLHLVLCFWIESILMCIVALVMAYLLALLALPYFNQVTGKYISLLDNLWLITPSLLLTLFIGLLSSIVPTIQAATLNVLKIGKPYGESLGKSAIRTILITFQFAISILLITATWIVSSQFSFLKSSRFGFVSDNVITIPVKDRSQNDRHQTISKEIGELTGVEEVSYSSSMPGANNAYTYTYTFTGTEVGEQTMAAFLVDDNFFELYEIKLKEGRLPNIESKDTITEVVLNEAAVEQFHLSSPIGQLVTGQVKGKVVGIIENFNYASLHSSIEPMILYSYPANFRFVSIKLNQGSFQNVISSLDKKWQELYPGYPLEYNFLNEAIQNLYGAEFQLSKAYTVFSFIAVIIAGVGLIGLATYLLTRKLKEISIRKVFGSSVGRIVLWIYSGYLKIIIIASIVAWGVGYYVMQNWLDGFAFKTEIEVYYFVIPPLIMTLLLLVATGFQSLKAAGTNPVENLRNE